MSNNELINLCKRAESGDQAALSELYDYYMPDNKTLKEKKTA